jgi:glucokinase
VAAPVITPPAAGEGLVGAVDIGGTNMTVGVIDGSGRVLQRADTVTVAREGFDQAMSRVGGLLEQLGSKVGQRLSGIGIGCTGPIDPFSGEISEVENLPGWRGNNPVAVLGQRFSLRVAMENDADAAALGELLWGAGHGWRNLICVTVGTGIGGGIILNGSLYRGVGGAHPEIGHHSIDDSSGPRCYCGARGCWESLASGTAIAAHARATAPADYPGREALTTEDLCARARRGDTFAQRAVERAGHYLGVGVANLITLYAPDAIVLSGNVMESADLFMPLIREVVRGSCGLVPASQIKLTTATLGNAAPLVGAAAAWWHRYSGEARAC